MHVVSMEGLFIQGEFLRTEGVVDPYHLRELKGKGETVLVKHAHLSKASRLHEAASFFFSTLTAAL